MKQIPYIRQNDLVKLCLDHKQQAINLLNKTIQTHGMASRFASKLLLPIADKKAHDWLIKTKNPYLDEICSYQKILNKAGIIGLNLSYEWGCTSGAFQTDHGLDMLRVLDWPFAGLGENLCVIHQKTAAGAFYNISWPAMSGVFQAMAPGRFSACINQAPMRRKSAFYLRDWLSNRKSMFQQTGLPPAHLLRYVFETAQNFTDAKKMLCETAIAIPVIYILAGTQSHEACIIERIENDYYIHEISNKERICTANQFKHMRPGPKWESRAIDSRGRNALAHEMTYPKSQAQDFSWLQYPIINPLTRLCMIANAKTGYLALQGFEEKGPVTQLFRNA